MSAAKLRACAVAALGGVLITATLYWHVEAQPEFSVPHTGVQDAAAPAVRIQFIGESLCPDCAAYTTNVLGPVYKSELKGIVDLDYVGWGNAKNSSGSISCQHGSRECKLNKALNCAQHECRSQEEFFKFLLCLEEMVFDHADDKVLKTCSSHAMLSEESIRQCMDGGHGEQLEAAAAAATPAHNFVPWILVDGVPLGADCGNLATHVCLAYRGKRPQLCSEPQRFHACPGAPRQGRGGLSASFSR